jgi:hypothetical protein
MRDGGGTPGTDGLGGGGGGSRLNTTSNGGSGRVILRYSNKLSANISPGSNTIANDGSDKVATFNVGGSISFT